MKYLAIVNDEKIGMVEKFLKDNDISFFSYGNVEERLVIEVVCDSLDSVLGEHSLSSDDITSVEDSIIDRATELLLESQHTFKELENYSVEVVKEVFEEKVNLKVLDAWASETDFSKSDILEICNKISEAYDISEYNMEEYYKKYQDCCSIWSTLEEFCSYMSQDEPYTIEMAKNANYLFELNNGEYLACM